MTLPSSHGSPVKGQRALAPLACAPDMPRDLPLPFLDAGEAGSGSGARISVL